VVEKTGSHPHVHGGAEEKGVVHAVDSVSAYGADVARAARPTFPEEVEALLVAEFDSGNDLIVLQIRAEIPKPIYNIATADEPVAANSYVVVVHLVAKHPSQDSRKLAQVPHVKVLPLLREHRRIDERLPGASAPGVSFPGGGRRNLGTRQSCLGGLKFPPLVRRGRQGFRELPSRWLRFGACGHERRPWRPLRVAKRLTQIWRCR